MHNHQQNSGVERGVHRAMVNFMTVARRIGTKLEIRD
jgi:hypothetical protein